MKVSIRKSTTMDGLSYLQVYRPRERTYSLPGSAYETKSGYWIVNIPGNSADVMKCMADAAFALQEHYAEKVTT